MAPKRILFYSPYALDTIRHGGARRSSFLWRVLSGAYDAHLIVHARAPQHAGGDYVRVTKSLERLHHPALKRLMRERLETFRPDLLWVEQFYALPMLSSVAREFSVPVVYSSQNVEAERFSGWSGLHAWGVGMYERWGLRHARAVVCVSERDRLLFNQRYDYPLDATYVVPNAYDEAVFRPRARAAAEKAAFWGKHGVARKGPVFLFVGGYHYLPNAEAIRLIEEEIGPALAVRAPEAAIALIGGGYPANFAPRSGNVVCIGEVDRIEECLCAADALLCPLSSGGGSRLKVIEALACGLVVISSVKGAEGLEDLGPEDGLHRVPLEAFAEEATRRLDDIPPRRTGIERYSSRVVSAQALDAAEHVLSATGRI